MTVRAFNRDFIYERSMQEDWRIRVLSEGIELQFVIGVTYLTDIQLFYVEIIYTGNHSFASDLISIYKNSATFIRPLKIASVFSEFKENTRKKIYKMFQDCNRHDTDMKTFLYNTS